MNNLQWLLPVIILVIWIINYALRGSLRVGRDAASGISPGVRAMQESDAYFAILDEGQEKHAKKAILLLGERRLGAADEAVKAQLKGITDLERLDRMLLQAASASSWAEILDTP